MKRLRDILKEDASDLTGGSIEGTLKGPHLKSMAENMEKHAQQKHGTSFNNISHSQQKEIFKHHLYDLEDKSNVQFHGIYHRIDKVREVLNRDHGINFKKSTRMTPEDIEHARNMISQGHTIKQVANVLGVHERTVRRHGVQGIPKRPPHPKHITDFIENELRDKSGNLITSLSNAKAREISRKTLEVHGYDIKLNGVRGFHDRLRRAESNG